MPRSDKQDIIIVRRYEGEEEPHGGAWKIALADFMTAMMAFFLVMWLVNATDKDTKKSIANYFNPVQLADTTPHRKGLNDPQKSSPAGEEDADQKTTPFKGNSEEEAGSAPHPQRPRYKEGALFQDPYAILAKIASEVDPDLPPDTRGIDVTPGDAEKPGLNGGEVYRDPFDPLYWQTAPTMPLATSAKPGIPETTTPVPRNGTLDVRGPTVPVLAEPLTNKDVKPGDTKMAADPQLSDKVPERPSPATDAKAEKVASQSQESELKMEIAKAVQTSGKEVSGPHVEVNQTGEGILISMMDEMNFSMFAVGSAEPEPKVVRAMEKIAKILSAQSGKIVIRGHTDGRPFKSDTYDNWRLSTARAHMASYMLVRGGIDERRIERIEGYADRSLKNPADPKAAENRRIEILLRKNPS